MKTALLLCGAAIAAGCASLPPEHQAAALRVIEQLRATGTITTEQAAGLTQALLTAPASAWWQELLQILGSVGLALLGVRWQRGPVATASERAARILQQAPPAA